MGRPKKASVCTPEWYKQELRLTERRLRALRRAIDASPEPPPGLLRLEAQLRRELERLSDALQTEPLGREAPHCDG